MSNIDREKTAKIKSVQSDSVPIETKTLEDFKCGNCGFPLLIHVFWRGEKYERVVECKKCAVSFPLEGNPKSDEPKAKPINSAKSNSDKKDNNNKESMVERLVKSWK